MKRKQILFIILAVMIISGTGIGYYYWYQGENYLETDDARIAGDIYRVMPRIAGKINSLPIKVGDTVISDQIVGQQDTTNLPTSMLDQATLRAPLSGTVIQTTAKTGEVVAPGQSVALVVDMHALYITANIEEKKVKRVKLGERVEFTIDTYAGRSFMGKVTEIGEATASSFSLLPATNTSGNFTKVSQRIGIKISIDDAQGLQLSPGMNAVVKIHVKGN